MIELLTSEAALADLWEPWTRLWRQAPDALPFLSPAWLAPWWRQFGTGQPVVATYRDHGALAGLLPLYVLGDKLLPMGVGISDYFDLLLAPRAPDGTPQRLLAAALAGVAVTRCDLPELAPDARLRRAAAPAGWEGAAWDGPDCPVLGLPSSVEALADTVPKGIRRDLRQARNRAAREGGWVVERAAPGQGHELLDELMRLHSGRWAGRGERGVLADPLVVAFHAEATDALLEAGLLRLEVLRLRGVAAAAIHALLGERRIYFYLSGFDAGFGFESPGTILLGHMIEEAVREGRREAHFLRGGERYKYAWGGLGRQNVGRSFLRT